MRRLFFLLNLLLCLLGPINLLANTVTENETFLGYMSPVAEFADEAELEPISTYISGANRQVYDVRLNVTVILWLNYSNETIEGQVTDGELSLDGGKTVGYTAQGGYAVFFEYDINLQAHKLIYDIDLIDEKGDVFNLYGFKVLRKGDSVSKSLKNLLPEVTTLHTVFSRYSADGSLVPHSAGIIKLNFAQVIKTLSTLKPETNGEISKLVFLKEFSRFFINRLIDIYEII